MRKFRAFAGKTLSAAAILAAALSASPASAKPDQLTVYGGPLNTSWYIMAGWLATELQKDGVKANSELGGALSNLIQIGRMPENMGFTFAAAAQMAYDGVKPFPGRVDKFCAIQLLQRSFFTAMVTVASGIESAAGLVGKTYSGQAVGNLSQVALSDFFKASGVNEKDIDIAVGGQQFGADGVKDRRFVGFAAMTGIPSPPVMDAATSVPVKFLPVDDALFEKVKALNGGYVRAEIPAGSYPGQDEAVPTFGTFTIMLMNPETSEDDQYFVTKVVHDNWAGLKAAHASTKWLTLENAAKVPGVPLCPGARKYWTEQGAL
ncbi:MAG: TAXI family TRAP transporter solute-binding subunit [Alphaproteobacteria bacterium]|nr:TAXI family TRAP transporter solute-binding subunit [Alphaproteobacteria bacterium]MCB9930355.1 TAXI family TRAP transporter solute-binding subunit [Alphaproteobacteria bacterium]